MCFLSANGLVNGEMNATARHNTNTASHSGERENLLVEETISEAPQPSNSRMSRPRCALISGLETMELKVAASVRKLEDMLSSIDYFSEFGETKDDGTRNIEDGTVTLLIY